jgi:hypothetical protein
MVILIKRTNQNNHASFIYHVFNWNKHIFSQYKYFNQVEPFEKSWFFVMIDGWMDKK